MRPGTIFKYIATSICIETTLAAVTVTNNKEDVQGFFKKNEGGSGHTNNWAVLVRPTYLLTATFYCNRDSLKQLLLKFFHSASPRPSTIDANIYLFFLFSL
jgi:hypothetical protein